MKRKKNGHLLLILFRKRLEYPGNKRVGPDKKRDLPAWSK